MSRMSGAARRKLKRNPTLFTTEQVREHVQDELKEQRAVLAAQLDLAKARRERARFFAFAPQPAAPLAHTPIQTRRP